MSRFLNVVTIAAAGWLFSGCFSAEVTVKLNPDGSGMLIERTMLNRQLLEQMKLLTEGLPVAGEKTGKQKSLGISEMFSEEQIRKRAGSYGPGVAVVSARKISDATAEGMEAVYSFKDVSRLRLNQKPDSMFPEVPIQAEGPATAGMPEAMRFERLPNGNALLTLTIPWERSQRQEEREAASSPPGGAEKGQFSQEQLAQALQMFQGMRVSLAVEPQGTLVSTDSPHVSGNRVTLFEMNMDEMLAGLANPASLSRLMSNPPADVAEARKLLEQFKGIKFCMEPEIRIEFSQ